MRGQPEKPWYRHQVNHPVLKSSSTSHSMSSQATSVYWAMSWCSLTDAWSQLATSPVVVFANTNKNSKVKANNVQMTRAVLVKFDWTLSESCWMCKKKKKKIAWITAFRTGLKYLYIIIKQRLLVRRKRHTYYPREMKPGKHLSVNICDCCWGPFETKVWWLLIIFKAPASARCLKNNDNGNSISCAIMHQVAIASCIAKRFVNTKSTPRYGSSEQVVDYFLAPVCMSKCTRFHHEYALFTLIVQVNIECNWRTLSELK